MSAHIEWGEVAYATPRLTIEPAGEITDSFGTTNDKPVLCIDQGGDFVVLEGTADDFIAFAARIHALGMDLKHIETRPKG